MRLALGPLQYYWPRKLVFDFYEAIAATSIDIVYLGETVCSRRHEIRLPDWISIAEQLASAGKQVVLSTQVLIESDADLLTMRKVVGNGCFMVEANDMGAVRCLSEAGLSFVAGPYLNQYNPTALSLLVDLGAKRWIMPLEMGQDDLAQMQKAKPEAVETEVYSYGRMPLAFSARCFTARHHNLPKDDCQFSCLKYPDGLLLKTKEEQPFLNLNGIQTQSNRVYNLINELPVMCDLGVAVMRISPQANHTAQIIEIFRSALSQKISSTEAQQQMLPFMPEAPCNGFWHGKSGMDQVA